MLQKAVTNVLIASCGLITACSTVPDFGPDANRIVEGAQLSADTPLGQLNYDLVEVNKTTIAKTKARQNYFSRAFTQQKLRHHDELISAGDVIEVIIWEVGDNALFASSLTGETRLSLRVSNGGKINIPYAGTVLAANRTPEDLREELLTLYRGKAVEPEVSVSIKETQSRFISVQGDSMRSGRVEIPSRGLKLLDALALAGGTKHPEWETQVKLQRGARIESLPLSDIISSSRNNVVVLPGDSLFISHEARRYAVYGAVGAPGNVEINQKEPTLSYLLAAAGGLNRQVAEAQSVFVFRLEDDPLKPKAFKFDYSRPDAFLLASTFKLHPQDVTYVPSADAADVQKFVSIVFSPIVGAANGAASIGN